MKSLVPALLLSSLASMLSAQPATPVEPPAQIEFTKLDSNRGHVDCGNGVPETSVCRVRVQRTADELRKHLAAGEQVWREGDQLSFVYEGDVKQVDLGGGIQYPLSRVPATNLWTVTVRVPQLDRAILSYFFMPMGDTPPIGQKFTPIRWRGLAAPPEPAKVEKLAGKIVKRTIDSKAMQMPRKLVIYEPPAVGTQPLEAVVYAGDGDAAESFAQVLEPLIASGRAPRIIIVGLVASATSLGRAQEYLLTMEDDNATFLKHETFFIEEVLPMIEREYAVPKDPARRATFGFSNSAAWAIDMGLRHPELFGRVLAFSPAGRKAALTQPGGAGVPSFYLLGGTLEKPFHDKAVDWSRVMDTAKITYTLREPVAGHDFAMWMAYFGEAVMWAFSHAQPR